MLRRLLTTSFLLLLSTQAFAQDQTTASLDELDELGMARVLLESAEEEFGRYSMDLVEPIEQFANLLMSLNQFGEADALLDRAVQITRVNNGLHTPAQLDLIRKRIDNFSNRQAWDDAREQMEYLFTYYLRVPVILNSSLLDDFLILNEQHLRGATEDEEIEQGRHLSRVYQLNWAMINTARRLYGRNSPELVPYLYRQVQHYYLFKKGREAGGRDRTNANYYYTLNGRTTGWRKIATKNRFYSEALRLLAEIRGIYSNLDNPDKEAVAMSELYMGDWFLLFDHAGMALESYDTAYRSLQAAGVSDEQINALFSMPRILPQQKFYPSVEAALNDLPVAAEQVVDAETNAYTFDLSFSEWSVDYPTLRSPLDSYSRSEEESIFARLSFELLAENEQTFFYANRFRQSVGKAENIVLIQGFRGIEEGREAALSRVEQLRFRPRMMGGLPVATRNTITYSIAKERVPERISLE